MLNQPEAAATPYQSLEEKRLTDDIRARRPVQYLRGVLAAVNRDGTAHLVQNPIVTPLETNVPSSSSNPLDRYNFFAAGAKDVPGVPTELTAYHVAPVHYHPISVEFIPTPGASKDPIWTTSEVGVTPMPTGGGEVTDTRRAVSGLTLDGILLSDRAYGEINNSDYAILQPGATAQDLAYVGLGLEAKQ